MNQLKVTARGLFPNVPFVGDHWPLQTGEAAFSVGFDDTAVFGRSYRGEKLSDVGVNESQNFFGNGGTTSHPRS